MGEVGTPAHRPQLHQLHDLQAARRSQLAAVPTAGLPQTHEDPVHLRFVALHKNNRFREAGYKSDMSHFSDLTPPGGGFGVVSPLPGEGTELVVQVQSFGGGVPEANLGVQGWCSDQAWHAPPPEI